MADRTIQDHMCHIITDENVTQAIFRNAQLFTLTVMCNYNMLQLTYLLEL